MWSGVIRVRAQHVVVDRGPYRLVRHPIYVAGLLLALGTFLAHPKLQHLPVLLEVPGKDGKGPDADEIRKLRELHAHATS